MEIQTRRQILEIWRATIEYSYRDGEWIWGGRNARNSISDAEQLLTILYPATVIDSLRVDDVDRTTQDVLDHLSGLGNAVDIPRKLVDFIGEYMRSYVHDDNSDFSGGSYFGVDDSHAGATAKEEQRELHVVDSYSMSVTLCLAVLGFLRVYRQTLRNQRRLAEIDEIERLSSLRLTAAMVGLLRSFTVNTFDPGDPQGQAMLKMVNQAGRAKEILVYDLLEELSEVRAGLREELRIGIAQVAEELENRGRMFECGWTWGVVDGSPEIEFAKNIGVQPMGVANSRPYLYFTVVALDGILDLFSDRTRILGLLDEQQQRIAQALQLRWSLTRQFWATVATFGSDGRWPLEDLPWTTSDEEESDYYSVLLTSIVLQGNQGDKGVDVDVERVGRLLGNLASRARITARMTKDDPAIGLHIPGMRLRLIGSEKVADGPRLRWAISSYSMLLLKRVLRVAELLDDTTAKIAYSELADQIWDHVERRKISSKEVRGLWDEPAQVFVGSSIRTYGEPSWYHTERVIEALVSSANLTLSRMVPPPSLVQHAEQMIAEAELLFDREQLRGTSDTGAQMRENFQVISTTLRRARDLTHERPGTAIVLAGEVLRRLDALEAARRDTARMS
ncbi:MAG TPA: SCO2524 family protein [Streptosporangiaceae bacterium]|jgi:hypothetical protein